MHSSHQPHLAPYRALHRLLRRHLLRLPVRHIPNPQLEQRGRTMQDAHRPTHRWPNRFQAVLLAVEVGASLRIRIEHQLRQGVLRDSAADHSDAGHLPYLSVLRGYNQQLE